LIISPSNKLLLQRKTITITITITMRTRMTTRMTTRMMMRRSGGGGRIGGILLYSIH